MSSGSPMRPSIARSAMRRATSCPCWSVRRLCAISVRMKPGATAFTVMPRGPSSMAKRFVRIATSAFVAA
jgi:hypothetical protein